MVNGFDSNCRCSIYFPRKFKMIMFFNCLILTYYLFFATSKLSYSDAKTSIVMTMICRDEEVNLRANLAQWFPVVDYFIFLIDSRNTDHTWYFIKRTFQGSKENSFKALSYDFEGFGHARTLVWKKTKKCNFIYIIQY